MCVKIGKGEAFSPLPSFFLIGVFSVARVFTVLSGSNGNCTYIGDAKSGILIDIGVSFSKLKNALEENGIDLNNIEALFITHEHSDHIKGLSVFLKKTEIPVFASFKTAEWIEINFPELVRKINVINCYEPQILKRMSVTPFSVYHDSVDAVGFRVVTGDNRTVVYSTDVGHIDDEIFSFIENADLNIIEANYDDGMLMCNASYSFLLKKRISGSCGHLSNKCCAETVARLYEKGNRRFLLAHLSEQNNTPQIAYETVKAKLDSMGLVEDVDYSLCVAPRLENSRMLIF